MEPDLSKTEARAGDRRMMNARVLLVSSAIIAVIAIVALSYAAII